MQAYMEETSNFLENAAMGIYSCSTRPKSIVVVLYLSQLSHGIAYLGTDPANH